MEIVSLLVVSSSKLQCDSYGSDMKLLDVFILK